MVAPAGIEPATRGFSVLCSTDWAMKPQMAVPTGFEPAIFCVTGRRDRPLHYGTNGCGRWIWTNDLWVMSPASYQAAPSRDITPKQHSNGGERGIRTPAPISRPPGFQDRSLQPDLGISPKDKWCLRSDLNRHEGWISQDFKQIVMVIVLNFINLCKKWLND